MLQYKRFETVLAVRLDAGEEILSCLAVLCEKEKIRLGTITGLGAVNTITIGLFDTKEKKYYSTKLEGDFEIVSLTGNISQMESKVYLHCHGAFSDITGKTLGGHLNEAWVSATAELFITVINGTVEREFNQQVGLNLFAFENPAQQF